MRLALFLFLPRIDFRDVAGAPTLLVLSRNPRKRLGYRSTLSPLQGLPSARARLFHPREICALFFLFGCQEFPVPETKFPVPFA